jgi:hypothetical protein
VSNIPCSVVELCLTELYNLGALERFMTTRSDMGIYNKVAVTVRYSCTDTTNLKSALFSALAATIARFSILSAIPVDTKSQSPYFARLPSIDLVQVLDFVTISKVTDNCGRFPTLDVFLEEQHNRRFEYTTPLSPFWKVYVLQESGCSSRFILSLFFHHCLSDTRGAVLIQESIEAALALPPKIANDNHPAQIIQVPHTPLLPPLDHLLPCDSTIKPPSITKNVPAEIAWTGGVQRIPTKTKFCSRWYSIKESSALIKAAKLHGFSLTATLQIMLVSAVFKSLPTEYTTIKVDCPVSLQRWLPSPVTQSSIGCFVDIFTETYHRGPFDWVEVERTMKIIEAVLEKKKGDEVFQSVSKVTDLHLFFESKMGKLRAAGLELSNIGRLPSTKEPKDYDIEGLLFSQSAGACSAAIKVSAATGRDGRMTLGFSWQDGVVEDQMVKSVISELEKVLQEIVQGVN